MWHQNEGRILTLFLILVGTSRCDVAARVIAGETNANGGAFKPLVPSPDASLGDGDGAARQSLPGTA
jgi:hypothetical protein